MEMNETHNNLPKRNLFTVPEGYFDRLEEEIRQRTSTPAQKTVWVEPAVFKFAGVAALIAFAAYLFLPEPPPSSPEDLLTSVTTEHLEAYLAENSSPEAEDILLPGSLNDESEIDIYFENDTLF